MLCAVGKFQTLVVQVQRSFAENETVLFMGNPENR